MESLGSLFLTPPPAGLPTTRKPSSLADAASSLGSVSLSSMISPDSVVTSKLCKILSPKVPKAASTLSAETSISSNSTIPATPKKVLVPIGFGTEEMEAAVLVSVLRRSGSEVTVASVEQQLEIEASSGTRLIADTSISTCTNQTFDLVALPGGMPGSVRLRDCESLQKILKRQADEKKLYGAISAAPAVTLLPWGLLRRKKTTCHPAFFDKLPTFWAVKSDLQVSGEVTTSRGPGTSFQFALSLVEQLYGESTAKSIGEFLMMHGILENPKKKEFNKAEWCLDHTPHVLIPVANGSEEIELIAIVDILRRAKVDVTVASVERSLRISASQGMKIAADSLISDAANTLYDLIILPGGTGGPERLQKSRILKKLLKDQCAAGNLCGAVNSSIAVLQKHGCLKEKRRAALPHVMENAANELVVGAEVVIDGNMISGVGHGRVMDFGLAIVSKLFGDARARSVAEGLVFHYGRS